MNKRPILRLKKPDHKVTPPANLRAGFSYLNKFPAIKKVLPLQVGVRDILLKNRPKNVSGRTVRRTLAGHCNRIAYVKAVAAGGDRYDLQGQPVGTVSPEHQAGAIEDAAKRGESA